MLSLKTESSPFWNFTIWEVDVLIILLQMYLEKHTQFYGKNWGLIFAMLLHLEKCNNLRTLNQVIGWYALNVTAWFEKEITTNQSEREELQITISGLQSKILRHSCSLYFKFQLSRIFMSTFSPKLEGCFMKVLTNQCSNRSGAFFQIVSFETTPSIDFWFTMGTAWPMLNQIICLDVERFYRNVK